jgi:hypothetical protein
MEWSQQPQLCFSHRCCFSCGHRCCFSCASILVTLIFFCASILLRCQSQVLFQLVALFYMCYRLARILISLVNTWRDWCNFLALPNNQILKINITASEWENKNFLSGAEQEKEVILSERYKYFLACLLSMLVWLITMLTQCPCNSVLFFISLQLMKQNITIQRWCQSLSKDKSYCSFLIFIYGKIQSPKLLTYKGICDDWFSYMAFMSVRKGSF